ncbi:MAG: VanZ family protein [Pseudomonadota bacterium]
MRYRTLWLICGWLLVAAVVYLSLTGNPPDTGIRSGDKLGHLLAYLSLMAWWGQLSSRHGRLLVVFIAMGALLEGLQSLTPVRQPGLLDMAANASGALLGWMASRRWPAWLPALESRLIPLRVP